MDFITFLLPGLLLTLLTLATLSCLGSSSLLGKRGLSILLCGNVELWSKLQSVPCYQHVNCHGPAYHRKIQKKKENPYQ